MDEDRWLTVRQVATTLQVAEKTVRRWIATGQLAATKITDRSGWRIRERDLAHLLHERRRR